MSDVANQDEARRCLDIATAALQTGNLEKANRFAEKAMRLYPSDEVHLHQLCSSCYSFRTARMTSQSLLQNHRAYIANLPRHESAVA